MSNYVIDENVIRNAWTGKKADSSPALAEMKFMRDVFQGNQHLAINEKIRNKITNWSTKAKEVTVGVDNLLVPLLTKTIFDSSRTTMLNGIPTNFRGVKECDVEFVGVALQAPNSFLVTADEKLKNAVLADPTVRHCRCVTAEEAIHTY